MVCRQAGVYRLGPGRIARLAGLCAALGYQRHVLESGAWGPVVSDVVARQDTPVAAAISPVTTWRCGSAMGGEGSCMTT
jgi:hypothetical protein